MADERSGRIAINLAGPVCEWRRVLQWCALSSLLGCGAPVITSATPQSLQGEDAFFLRVTNTGGAPLVALAVRYDVAWCWDNCGEPFDSVAPTVTVRHFTALDGAVVSEQHPLLPGASAVSGLVALGARSPHLYLDPLLDPMPGGPDPPDPGDPPPDPPEPQSPGPEPYGTLTGLTVTIQGFAAREVGLGGQLQAAPPNALSSTVLGRSTFPLQTAWYDATAAAIPLLRPGRTFSIPGSSGRTLSAGAYGWLWMLEEESMTLFRLDPVTGLAAATVSITASFPTDIGIKDNHLYMVEGVHVTTASAATGTALTSGSVSPTTALWGVTTVASSLVAGSDSSIGALRMADLSFESQFVLGFGLVPGRLGTLGEFLTLMDDQTGTIALLEPTSGELVASYTLPPLPFGFCGADATGPHLFVDGCLPSGTFVYDLLLP